MEITTMKNFRMSLEALMNFFPRHPDIQIDLGRKLLVDALVESGGEEFAYPAKFLPERIADVLLPMAWRAGWAYRFLPESDEFLFYPFA